MGMIIHLIFMLLLQKFMVILLRLTELLQHMYIEIEIDIIKQTHVFSLFVKPDHKYHLRVTTLCNTCMKCDSDSQAT